MTHSGHATLCRVSIAILAAAMLAGCAKEPVLGGLGGNAPNPNGCYVFLYDQENWRGKRVVLNGPGKWQSVERLQRNDDKDWRKNIRSIEIGSSATVTLYTEQNYSGVSQQFGPASDQARFNGSLSAGIESLALSCRPTTP
jgi:Peptidase inhibitor family I36